MTNNHTHTTEIYNDLYTLTLTRVSIKFCIFVQNTQFELTAHLVCLNVQIKINFTKSNIETSTKGKKKEKIREIKKKNNCNMSDVTGASKMLPGCIFGVVQEQKKKKNPFLWQHQAAIAVNTKKRETNEPNTKSKILTLGKNP